MKVFFADALQDMVTELRGQGVNNVRLQVLPEVRGEALVMRTHVTTLCNNQIYESVLESSASLEGIAQQERAEFIRNACEQEREKVAKRLPGFELRGGILQG